MPQVLPVAAYYAAQYFGASAVLSFGIAAATAIATNEYTRKQAARKARDAYNASLTDRLVMASLVDGARSRIYGRARNVDGVLFKGTWGPNSEVYSLVIALAGHECDGIESIYFGDQPVELDADGWVLTEPYLRNGRQLERIKMTPNGGPAQVTLEHDPIPGTVVAVGEQLSGGARHTNYEVTVEGRTVTALLSDVPDSVTFSAMYATGTSKARVWQFLGAPGQNLAPMLKERFPALIQDSDRFEGMCCLLVDLYFDPDAFPLGLPPISAVVRGAKIYDPRNGRIEWSHNPALVARDWALYAYGGGAAEAELDDANLIAEANTCDLVLNFNRSDGQVPMPLYRCDIVCKLGTDPTPWMDEMVESMAGRWAWAGGQLRLIAGTYRPAVVEITEDWLSGAEDLQLVKDAPRAEVVNVYRPSIADSVQHYVVSPMPEVRAESYIAQDGQELAAEIELAGVTDPTHAQHVCTVLMRDARDALTLTLPCNFAAFAVQLFDVVRVTLPHFGLVGAEMMVLGWRMTLTGGVVLTLKKHTAASFDLANEFIAPRASDNTALPLPWRVPAVDGLTVTSGTPELVDGTPQTRTLVSWLQPADESVAAGRIELQYLDATAPVPAGDWPGVAVEGRANQALVMGLRRDRYHLFRARGINALGVRGPWSATQLHQVRTPDVEDSAAAREALAAANLALGQIAQMLSDGALTPDEKPAIAQDWQVIVSEQPGLDAQAVLYDIPAEQAAYDGAVAALGGYLGSLLTPVAWNDLNGSTAVDGPTLRGLFAAVYGARQALLNKVQEMAAARNATRPNLLVNGGFERGYVNWWVHPSMAVSDGTWCRTLSGTPPDGTAELRSDSFVVTPGATYTVTGDSMCFAAAGSVYFDMLFFDSSGQVMFDGPEVPLLAGHDFATDDSNRQRHAVAAVAPEGSAWGCARCVWQDLQGCVILGFRQIKVERGGLPATRYTAEAALSAASDAANAAAAAAAAANQVLASIASDNVLSPGEKTAVMLDWQVIAGEQPDIDAKASGQGIVDERAAYNGAVAQLWAYLQTLLAPVPWNDTSGETAIDGPTFRQMFAAVYLARQALLNVIATRIAAGSIGTDHIAPGAATEVFVSDVVPGPVHYGEGERPDHVVSRSFIPSSAGQLIVTCTFSAQRYRGADLGTRAFYAPFMTQGEQTVEAQRLNLIQERIFYTARAVFDVVPGVLVTAGLRGGLVGPTSCDFYDAQVMVELIKR